MKRTCIGDIVVLVLILAASALFFLLGLLPKEEGVTLEVTCGDETAVYSLEKEQSFDVVSGGHTLHVEIRSRKVRVVSSTCPDKVCVHQGEIDSAGETIVCVPSGAVLRIKGGETGEEDIVAG